MGFCCAVNCINEDDRNYLDLPHGTHIPVKNRKQTDLPYFISLVAFFSFLVVCVCVAGSQSDIKRFFNAYDSKGNLCGFKNEPIEGIDGTGLDLTEKKFIKTIEYCSASDLDDCWIEKHCVESCEHGYALSIIPSCSVHGEGSSLDTPQLLLVLIYSDLSLCWKEIVLLCFCSIFLSGLIIAALRMFAKVVIRIIIVIVFFTIIGWTAYTWYRTVDAIKRDNALGGFHKSTAKEMYNWIYTCAFFTIFSIVLSVTLYKMRSKLPLIAAVVEEGSKCIKDIPTMLLQPILTNLITAVFTCFLCFGLICFQTSGKAALDGHENVYFPVSVFFQITSWLLIFPLFWLSQFFLACQNIVIAGAVSSWYFLRIKGNLTHPVWRSFCTLVKYHLGSSAFGSFIIAFIKIISLIVRTGERSDTDSNRVAASISCTVKGILACIETIVKILNKSAYVMLVLFGEPFCSSARKASACLTSDSSKIALIIGAGTFILSSVELVITITVTFIGTILIMNIEGVQVIWIPAVTVFFLSFLCCHCFFSVYEMTIDTLILCFCVDRRMNNGVEKPYYMNKNLTILLNEEEPDNANPNSNTDHNII